MDKTKILRAGKIASEVKKYAKKIVKKNIPLLELAEKIENKIVELGGKPAFPINLSIDNIAAHYTPSATDKTLASGLLKVDLGVHVDGWLADTAFSADLENSEENKKLIQASEDALKNGIEIVKNSEKNGSQVRNIKNSVPDSRQGTSSKKLVNAIKNSSAENRAGRRFGASNNTSAASAILTLSEIGATIQKTIESHKFSPIINLSGHSMENYDLHAGITIPNTDDKKNVLLKNGLYAIEPFASTGTGKVHDGKPSGIYALVGEKSPRSQNAREILEFIREEYQTLPFCSRWLVKKFGAKVLFALKELQDNGNIHQFAQLAESQDVKVSQAENTIFVDGKEIIVTTE